MAKPWHLPLAFLFSASLVSANNLLSVLNSIDNLSTLQFHINASTTLFNLITTGNNITLIAPSDTAFDAFFTAAPSNPTEDDIEELLTYHLLQGTWPSATFAQHPRFVSSFLNNSGLANVTGGQAVGLLDDGNGKPMVLSANLCVTPLVQQDIIFVGGIIHLVDSMLDIPPSIVTALTEAKLNQSVALISQAGLLVASAQSLVKTALAVDDLTVFMPNSQAALTSFTQATKNASQTDTANIFEYHTVQNFVAYSDRLVNGMRLNTLEGATLKVTIEGNETFINGAKIITSDFLIANGVMHIIDDLLNPFNITVAPVVSAATTSKISEAALGVGLTFAFLVPVFAGIFLFWFIKRRNESNRREDAAVFARQISRPVTGSSRSQFSYKTDLELADVPVTESGKTPFVYPPLPRPARPKTIVERPKGDGADLDSSNLYPPPLAYTYKAYRPPSVQQEPVELDSGQGKFI